MILCDIMMPGVDGYEVLRRLKANAATAIILFIHLTASVEKSEVEKGIEMGANNYIRKPFETPELLQAIVRNLTM